jgi:fructose/tagatose bisphosphate aldolase
MPLVSFHELMDDAERGGYAVGYFESWNLESLLAVADAAEHARSPVILGFSGIYLPSPRRLVADPLGAYSAMGLEVARGLSVPACLLFNESPYVEAVIEAIHLGFGLVMYTEDSPDEYMFERRVAQVVQVAHEAGRSVEAETMPLEGVGGGLASAPESPRLTDPEAARGFVEQTDVDALAVNIGQAHLHGRATVRLDLDRLARLRGEVPVPLVLHGASSVDRDDLRAAIGLGVRKVNVGSALKQAFLTAMRATCLGLGESFNPYEAIGSGLDADVLVPGRLAMQRAVEDYMKLFGSAGKAGRS